MLAVPLADRRQKLSPDTALPITCPQIRLHTRPLREATAQGAGRCSGSARLGQHLELLAGAGALLQSDRQTHHLDGGASLPSSCLSHIWSGCFPCGLKSMMDPRTADTQFVKLFPCEDGSDDFQPLTYLIGKWKSYMFLLLKDA